MDGSVDGLVDCFGKLKGRNIGTFRREREREIEREERVESFFGSSPLKSPPTNTRDA